MGKKTENLYDNADRVTGNSAADSADIVYGAGDVVAERFEVVSYLGKGGLAVVYKVVDRLTGEHVALKTIRPSRRNLPLARQCLIHEVIQAHKLHHPRIVDIYGIHEYNSELFCTMRYIEGVTLRRLLLQRGTLPLGEAAEIIRQLCLALEYLHGTMVHTVMYRPKTSWWVRAACHCWTSAARR